MEKKRLASVVLNVISIFLYTGIYNYVFNAPSHVDPVTGITFDPPVGCIDSTFVGGFPIPFIWKYFLTCGDNNILYFGAFLGILLIDIFIIYFFLKKIAKPKTNRLNEVEK